MESNDDFIVHSNSGSLTDKGILIHIVEDSSIISTQSQSQQSAVLINLPDSNNGIVDDMHHFEVFANAEVLVSYQYLACIPEDKNTFFNNLCTNVQDIRYNNDNNMITLEGAWNKVLQAQDIMRAYLISWKQHQELISDAYDSLDIKELIIKSETSTLITPEISPSKVTTRHQLKLQNDKEQESQETLVPVPPRDNKENEVHLSISFAKSESPSVPEEDSTDVPVVTTNCPYIKDRLKKKNYEECAPYKFFCNMCSFKTKRESHYNSHIKKHQKASIVYSCDTCSFTTIRLGHLRRHELTHSTTTLKCPKCSYQTDEERHLIRHQRMKHDAKDVVSKQPVVLLSCKKCTYNTTRPHLFERHAKRHQTDLLKKTNSISFQCEQCPYKAYRKEHYLRHVNNVHQNNRPYLCHLCGKAFKRPDALKQHAVTHADLHPNVKVFRCDFCNKGCRSLTYLKEHMAVHSNVRAFLCEVCGLSFKTRSVQRKHVATIHKNPQAFSCHKCLKKFNTKYALRRHMKQHSWNEERAANDDSSSFPHALVIQNTEETINNTETLTVHISEEILASLPSKAVPIFLASSDKKLDDNNTNQPVNLQISSESGDFLNSEQVIIEHSEQVIITIEKETDC